MRVILALLLLSFIQGSLAYKVVIGSRPLGYGEYTTDNEIEGPLDPLVRANIFYQVNQTIHSLGLNNAQAARAPTKLSVFPMKINTAVTWTDYQAWTVTNWIDNNPSYPNQITDFQCGTRSYDNNAGYNHQGIDLALWPFAWRKMSNNLVKIVAAAAGTLVGKADGYFDQECTVNSNQPNYVAIKHADGNIAYYYHMKSGTPTTKAIGSAIAAGEAIGYVGSSGSSTTPHLHFEVQNSGGAVIDPNGPGSCGGVGLWNAGLQPAYTGGIVMAIRISTSSPGAPSYCPAQIEADSNVVSYGYSNQNFYFAVYLGNFEASETLTLTVKYPNGNIRNQVNLVPGQFYSMSWWYWYWGYGTSGADVKGTYSVTATLSNGNTRTRTFSRN